MSSLEDAFELPYMPSVKFYMPVSQGYNYLDFTVSEDKKLSSKASEARPTGLVH